ncbi:MAG: carbohydrate kinase family protein [Patescibacteria group bacterium]|nr:carbohydrate kinase family protein [Patescibacteria group bacterium]
MPKYDFITLGGTTEDITVFTDEGVIIENKDNILQQRLFAFEYGAKIKVDQAYSTFGGGASNAAVCLSRLDFKTAAMVAVGDDERGQRIMTNFIEHNVSTSLMQVIKKNSTGFSFLLVGQEHEHVVFSNRAANEKLKITPAQVRDLDCAKWVYMTSLSGKWQSVLNNVFKTKAKIAWNPGHIQLHAGFSKIGKYLAKTEVLSVNQDEAIELVVTNPKYKNKSLKFLNNIKNLLFLIKDCGPKIVLITRGHDGADAYDGEKYYHQDILNEKTRVDTTGVGDAFGSTFVAGLKFFDGDIQKSLYLSSKNTASVIAEQGAQNGLLTKRQILRGIKQI